MAQAREREHQHGLSRWGREPRRATTWLGSSGADVLCGVGGVAAQLRGVAGACFLVDDVSLSIVRDAAAD